MNIHSTKRTIAKARSAHRDCCEDECPSGSRNNYFLGKRMTPDSYRLEQDYGIERRRLLNRAVHGWGVVYGFALRSAAGDDCGRLEPGSLGIGEGLALDRLGRELIQARGVALTLDNLLVLDGDGKPIRVDGCDLDERFAKLGRDHGPCWLLSVHYAEKSLAPLTLKDQCDCKRKEWDRTCETVVYSLRPIDCDDCCAPQPCELHCCCPHDSHCCDDGAREREAWDGRRRALEAELEEALREAGDYDEEAARRIREKFEEAFDALARERAAMERKRHPRGGCACLCTHLAGLEIGDSCARLRDVDDCTRADLGHGVALACLELARDECGALAIAGVRDACGPRRLVKRNDLLFDLISGCDATRIVETGWAPWHRREQPVPFDRFAAALGWKGVRGEAEYPTEDFWVRFSRPVRKDTLAPDCFAMTVMTDQVVDVWPQLYRIPIHFVDAIEAADDPPGYASTARIVVGGVWLEDAVLDDDAIFVLGDTRIEIAVRGDFILDCLDQTVSAKPHGRSPFPSGGGEPGHTYLSTFTVAQRRLPPKPVSQRTAGGRRSPATAR